MTVEYNHIYFPSEDSHYNPMYLTENQSFQIFWSFQEDHHEFYDPIAELLEKSYSASSIAINRFHPFLMLIK